jgi:hypothetical protein
MKHAIAVTGPAALVATLALGLGAVPAAPASAHEFLSIGGPLPVLVLVLSDNTQVYVFSPLSAIECKHFVGHGEGPTPPAMAGMLQVITGTYSGCKVVASGAAATITPVEYEARAEGTVTIVQPIVITIPAANCSVKVDGGGGANKRLSQLLFLNRPGGDVLVHAEVESIKSLSSGGACGTAGLENRNGTYLGLFLARGDGAAIDWI